MISYKRILYCTDFSEDAEIAFYHAVDLAKRHGARVKVLHILPSRHRYQPTETADKKNPGEVVTAEPGMMEEARAGLVARYGKGLEDIPEVEYEVGVGTPFVEILRRAREDDVDLIVLGAAGASETEQTHYGSTVDQVARRAGCHVMAIRNPEKTYTL